MHPGLETHLLPFAGKLPALRKATNVAAHPQIVLVSRSGFAPALHEAADRETRLRLVDIAEMVNA